MKTQKYRIILGLAAVSSGLLSCGDSATETKVASLNVEVAPRSDRAKEPEQAATPPTVASPEVSGYQPQAAESDTDGQPSSTYRPTTATQPPAEMVALGPQTVEHFAPTPGGLTEAERRRMADDLARQQLAANRYVPAFTSTAPVAEAVTETPFQPADAVAWSAANIAAGQVADFVRQADHVSSSAALDEHLAEYRSRVETLHLDAMPLAEAGRIRNDLAAAVDTAVSRISTRLGALPASPELNELQSELARVMENPQH